MDLEGLKKRVNDFKDDWERSRQRCEIEDFSDDVISLIAIIEQAEKALEDISKEDPMIATSEAWYIKNEIKDVLKAIRGS